MDRRQQTHVDQVSRDFANLQQNGAFDAQAGSPQYVQDTQHMYTPHPLDRNAQGDSRSGAASASAKPTAGPALYPAANNHASSSMADNQPLVPVAASMLTRKPLLAKIITTTTRTSRRTLSDTIVAFCVA